MASRLSQLLTLGGIGLISAANCIYLVDPGEKALIMNNLTGLKKQVFNQGYHIRIPFIEVPTPHMQNPIIYDARLKTIDIHVTTGTKDLQTVTISLRILQQPVAEKLPDIHQLLGKDYEKKVFNSIGQEILRTIVAQCTPHSTQTTPISSSNPDRPSARKFEADCTAARRNST